MREDQKVLNTAEAWFKRQGRRVRWVVRDLVHCLRGIPRLVSSARQRDEPVGFGLLEGGPWALLGAANAYRVRLVNDTPARRDVEVWLRAEISAGGPFEVRAQRSLDARAASDLYVVTDLVSQFELSVIPPSVDHLRVLAASPAEGCCRVTATLASEGQLIDELVIVQGLAE